MNNLKRKKKRKVLKNDHLTNSDQNFRGTKGALSKIPVFVYLLGLIFLLAVGYTLLPGLTNITGSKGSISNQSLKKQRLKNPIFSLLSLDQSKPLFDNVVHLYNVHPDDQCRKDMTSWLNSGDVYIEIVDRMDMPDVGLESSMYFNTITKKNVPGIAVPSDFLKFTRAESDDDVMMEKFSNLYHEYIHLKNHINGTYLLSLDKEALSKLSVEEQAKYHWGIEHSAYYAQWDLLKRYNSTRLMVPDKVLAEKGEAQAMMDYFLDMLRKTHSDRSILSQEKFDLFDKIWQEMAKKEIS